jgi:hypothetical protein
MGDAFTFLVCVWTHIDSFYHHRAIYTFKLLSPLAFSVAHGEEGLFLLQQRAAHYASLCQMLHSVVPHIEVVSMHWFIKEVFIIIEKKSWSGIHYTTRTRHVRTAWHMIAYTTSTAQTRVVRALWQAGKLYEAINVVYVYALMHGHTHPTNIYNWACSLLLLQ